MKNKLKEEGANVFWELLAFWEMLVLLLVIFVCSFTMGMGFGAVIAKLRGAL